MNNLEQVFEFIIENKIDVKSIESQMIIWMWKRGDKANDIAKILNISIQTVMNKTALLRRKYPTEMNARVKPSKLDESKLNSDKIWLALPDIHNDREIIELWITEKDMMAKYIAAELDLTEGYVINRISTLRNRYPELKIPKAAER